MHYRRLGRSGLKVSVLCLGSNVMGWTADERTSHAVLDAFAEGGGTFIDTADSYSTWVPGNQGGEAETIIGNWLKARGNRARMVVATKVGSRMSPDPNAVGLSRQHIMASVEGSLRRLQTDYIDLYIAHWDDPDLLPVEETVRAFDDLVRQGKVRYVGASNLAGWRLLKSLWIMDKHGYARYESLQPHYSLVHREQYEREYEPIVRDQELGVTPYYPLAAGFLTGKYRRGQPLPPSPRASSVQQRFMNERGFTVLEAVESVAAAHGATPAQVALAWLMARPGITAPIASATSVEQVRELLGAAELRLDPEAIATLDRASDWRGGQ